MEKATIPARNLSKQNFLSITKSLLFNIGKRFTKKKIFIEIICSLLVFLFIYTGINKIMDYDNFKFQMGRSPFIQNMSGFIAISLPLGELLIALSLVIKQTRLIGLYVSFGLMALFTGYIWLMLNYAYDLPCSCGGILAKMSWRDHLIFNSVFTILAATGAVFQSKIIVAKKIKGMPMK